MLYVLNTNVGHYSIIVMLESQVGYVMRCAKVLLGPGLAFMNAKADRQAAYVEGIRSKIAKAVRQDEKGSWRQTADGKNTVKCPGFTIAFRLMLGEPALRDFELQPTRAAPASPRVGAAA